MSSTNQGIVNSISYQTELIFFISKTKKQYKLTTLYQDIQHYEHQQNRKLNFKEFLDKKEGVK